MVVPSNSLATIRPDLAAEWHPNANGSLTALHVTPGRSVDVVWQCQRDQAHVWTAQVRRRNLGQSNCPRCPRPTLRRRRALADERPDLVAQWHPTRNGALTPADVSASSRHEAWWRCAVHDDHEWSSSISARTARRGSGCPFCAGKKVAPSQSLAVLRPDLAEQLHPTRNGDLSGDDISTTWTQKVWWQCDVGPDHVWLANPNRRSRGAGCAVCAGTVVVASTCLATLHPDLAEQWHPTRNGALTPRDVTPGSTKRRIVWQCPNEPTHTWVAPVSRRVQGTGCPMCAGVTLTPERSLAAAHPDIAAQWHPSANGNLTPATVAGASGFAATWQCARDPSHVWIATVSNRTVNRHGCPHCQILPRSKAEVALAAELSAFAELDPNHHKVVTSQRARVVDCDIVLSGLRTVVEYDGAYWHAGEDKAARDVVKTKALEADGWLVVRVRERPLPGLPTGVNVSVNPGDIKAAAVGVLAVLVDAGKLADADVLGYDDAGLLRADLAQRWVEEHLANREAARGT